MPKIRLQDAQPGMELASDITNQGIPLFKKGFRITKNQIEKLRHWGVTNINIVEDTTTPNPAHLLQEEITKEKADYLFSNINTHHPFFRELIACWQQRFSITPEENNEHL